MNSQALLDAYSYFFARKRFYRLNKLLFHLSLRGLGVLNYQNDQASGEEHFLRGHLAGRGCPVVFDVGANLGSYSLAVLAANPSARIFAFEPHPETFRGLSSNLAGCGVELVNAGCGSEEGRIALYDYSSAGSEHASLYQGVIEQLHGQKARSHDVRIVPLDGFASDRGIARIDLLKIDTEGHELEVLAGAKRLIADRRVTAIHFEFNEMNVISRTYFRDFHAALPEYDLYRMVRDGLVPLTNYSAVLCELFAFQNVVAMLRPAT
jgi:FkbM family methyltransferase